MYNMLNSIEPLLTIWQVQLYFPALYVCLLNNSIRITE